MLVVDDKNDYYFFHVLTVFDVSYLMFEIIDSSLNTFLERHLQPLHTMM